VLLWDLVANRERLTFRGHQGFVNAVAFSPDSQTVASSGGEGTITLWDPKTGRVRAILAGHPQLHPELPVYLRALSFSPDGAALASTAFSDPNVRLWDVASGQLRAALQQPCYYYSALAFAPDGQILATVGDLAVTFWDVATGQERRAFPVEHLHYSALAYSPDGKLLALGGKDGEITLWEMDRVLPKKQSGGTGSLSTSVPRR
jgi:WD40 repeat protein